MSPSFDFRGLDSDELGRLLDLLAESDVEECEIEQGESRVAVKRIVHAGTSAGASAAGPSSPVEKELDGPVTIDAQAVGIFYRSEKRSGPPRVEVGSKVKVGDILGYIEVMRIPHSVISTHDGIVESFLTEDGEPAEYGQPLVSIQPA
jgi:acetyl-CoA carboxylase biotin carboxyl carrier protein